MTKHISVRVAWHSDGWNGHVCKDPKRNSYCSGQYSYPGEMIGETRTSEFIEWECRKDVAGKPCEELKDGIPPCIYSINAFGDKELTAYSDPPEWFNDNSKQKRWGLSPYTICTWPYEEMYRPEVKNSEGRFDYDKRLAFAKDYFKQLEVNKSLIFYYANYSNPSSENEAKNYLLVGISRLKK